MNKFVSAVLRIAVIVLGTAPVDVSAQWLHNVPDPDPASDHLVAPGTSPTSWYTTPENVQHIGYVGTDQRIHELFFLIQPPYADSTGIVVESVKDFGGVGDLLNSIANGDGFLQGMVFPGSPFL